MFKNLIQKKLESYVKTYLSKHPEVKLVVVTGSVGKTSTKMAIATVLLERFRVRVQEGNFNTQMSAPLSMLGVEYPSNIRSISAWLAVFSAVRERIKQPADVDVIVQELGSDRIGEIAHFGKYLKPDIAVVSAVSPEHMEFFLTLDNVAKEELGVSSYSKTTLINRNDIDVKYDSYLAGAKVNTYGTSDDTDYHFFADNYAFGTGYTGTFTALEWQNSEPVAINIFGKHMIRPAIAAAAVAIKMGMNPSEIASGLAKIRPVKGRMNTLRGIKNSFIIDDTYNSSPLAVEAALNELYRVEAPQRIVVLGDMNELGETSALEHENLGKLCDPNKLAWVVTVGTQAEKYLAPAAKALGCQVKSFKDAISAGGFVRGIIDDNAAILLKGSQGGIFLEEATKIILHSSEDEENLVRQSPEWMAKKQAFFASIR